MCENANVMIISAIFANTNGILVNFWMRSMNMTKVGDLSRP